MRVLLVRGMGGSRKSRDSIRKHYEDQGYTVDEIEAYQLNIYQHYGYDLYVGHSLGSMSIQSAPWISSEKIETWGSPHHVRGTKKNTFLEGHSSQPTTSTGSWWQKLW